MLIKGDLQHDGPLEADCSRKKLRGPLLLRAISALSTNLSIAAPALRCVFGRGERREHCKIAWRRFIKEIDASEKRARGSDCDWAPAHMQRSDQDARSRNIARPELLAAVTVDYDGAGILGIAAALEERLPEMPAMNHAMSLLFGCRAHGKRALQNLAGATNCDDSEVYSAGISLVNGQGGVQEVERFMELLREEGRLTWATWVELKLIQNAFFPQLKTCPDPPRLLASDATNSNESSHQEGYGAGKHQGVAQGIMSLRAADQRKVEELRARAQARGAGRDAPGRARHRRAASRRSAARRSKRKRKHMEDPEMPEGPPPKRRKTLARARAKSKRARVADNADDIARQVDKMTEEQQERMHAELARRPPAACNQPESRV